MAAKKQTRKKAKNKRRGPSMASLADRYELYLKAVQAPDVDVRFLQRAYRTAYGEMPRVLREDFCGTAAVCCEWVKLGPERRAFGVDIDPEPLAWGREHNLSRLKSSQLERVELVTGDARTAPTPKADVVAAENFSFCFFKTRDALRDYFRAAHRHLADRGALVCDLFGGYEVVEDDREDETDHDGFTYVWHQDTFDPITHHALFHIHFRFPDKSEITRAFSYDWRLWTIPEIRELMLEAGFTRADVWWEGTDRKTGEGTGVFHIRERGEADPAWNAYVVGVK